MEPCWSRVPRAVKDIADEISRMEVHPEVLRATLASSALRCFGRVLQRGYVGDLHRLSFPTKRIRCFWSHSWHASAWMKVLIVFVYYNGGVAIASGTLAAGVAGALFYFELLPSTQRAFSLESEEYAFGPWAFAAGCTVAALVLFMYRPRNSPIFLDRICIHQTDDDLKTQGIMSIGGFLRHSESMLVLFDKTYPTRLWTIFELAAFLRSHEDATERLIIRPIFLGPAVVFLFLALACFMMGALLVGDEDVTRLYPFLTALAFLIFVFGGHILRSYFREIDECHRRLKSFTLREVSSHCCSVKHLDEDGRALICDREIITECIRSWFGSEEQFEEAVRSQVSNAFVKGVGYFAVPFSWFLGGTTSIMWACMDLSLARLRAGAYHHALVSAVYGLLGWLGICGLGYFICLWFVYKLRRRREQCLWDYAITVLGTASMLLICMPIHLVYPMLMRLLGDIPGLLVWGLIIAAYVIVWRWLWLRTTRHVDS